MFQDTYVPSFSNTLLYGLDFDFLMLFSLIIACADRANYLPNDIQSGLVFGALLSYITDGLLTWFRSYKGKKNLAVHTLSDEKFMIG